MSAKEEIKGVAVAPISVPVCRAPWVKFKNPAEHGGTSEQSSMLLAQIFGDGGAPDGARVHYAAAGTVIRVSFEYEGDDQDAKHHQTYDIDIGELADALHKLNKRRRADGFVDAPVEVR